MYPLRFPIESIYFIFRKVFKRLYLYVDLEHMARICAYYTSYLPLASVLIVLESLVIF